MSPTPDNTSQDRRGRSPRPSPRRSRSKRAENESSSVEASPDSWNVERGRSRVRRPSNPFSEDSLRRRGYHALLSSFGKIFHVEKRWKLIREMGSGAYGVVISAADEISGETVAIKQVNRVFDKTQLAKRALREVTLLRHFANHENITGLIDLDCIGPDFNEIYIFMEPMEADLHQIIKSGQSLTNEHVQYFLYQVLRGMKYIHSASVVHRDLKPGNLLVNADCELKICDFGLSRGFEQRPDENVTNMTEYVATRWYRAPEIMLAFRRYDTAIDVWSIGCIFAELLMGKPLFKGKDYVDQLNKILDVLGTPDNAVVTRIGSDRAQAYVRSLPIKKKVPFSKLLPSADALAVDLLEKMLAFDPAARITVPEALAHPWLEAYHDEADEPNCATTFDRWRQVEELETIEEFRAALWAEIQDHRREVRAVVPESPTTSVLRTPSGAPSVSPALGRAGLPDVAEEPASALATPPPEIPVEAEAEAETQEAGGLHAFPTTRDSSGSREPMPADPVVTYARRSSLMRGRSYSTYGPTPRGGHRAMPSFDGYYTQGHTHAHEAYAHAAAAPEGAVPFPSAEGASYVMPARTRTMSTMAGGEWGAATQRRLLRTLSTVSIHETGPLEEIAIGRFIVEKGGKSGVTEADRPPSALPQELKGTPPGTEGTEGGEAGTGSTDEESVPGAGEGKKFTL